MPPPKKKQRGPKTLRNTNANIIEVDFNHLEEGKDYIIQHKKEDLGTITERYTDQPGRFITRFRGKFVQLNVGKSEKYPEGLPSGPFGIPNGKQVALFENVEIVSNPDKKEFTKDIYVVKPGRSFSVSAFATIDWTQANNAMRQNIISKNFPIAFSTGTWSFGEIYQKLTDENRLTQIQSQYVDDEIAGPTGRDVFDPKARPGTKIGSFLGVQPPPPDPSLDYLRNPDYSKYSKGGRSYRRRKNKSHKRSRKRRTMKHR